MNSFRLRAYFNYLAGKMVESLGSARGDPRRQLKGFQRKCLGLAMLEIGDARAALASSVRVPQFLRRQYARENSVEARARAEPDRLHMEEVRGKASRP